ncbi:MAG: PAS domain S-box protein [Solirubrobacterales bacterium]|nr:PAS domain S-box protein [Solirubrobacterales bacterium]
MAATDRPSTPLAHLARLFEMTPDLLAAAGFDGYLRQFNDAWEREMGWSRPQLETLPYMELVHPEDRDITLAAIGRVAQGEAVQEHICRMVRRGGEVRWFSWSGGPGGPAEDQFYIVGRDVTERVALEREIASVAAHDLSEPLRVVSGYLDLLERRAGGRLDDEGRRLLDEARGGAQRMRRLIDDVLAFSGVANRELERAPVDLGVVAGSVLEDLRHAIDEARADVRLGRLPTVAGDQGALCQLLLNLVGNAIKFRAPDRAPVVDVGASRNGDGWVLVVADNGIGIPDGDRDRVFSMFTRLRRTDAAGTGIGLAICRRIAERHGGRIWVETADGGGSAFHVLLPDPPAQTS